MPNFILIHKLIEGELREENAILLSGQDSNASTWLLKKLSNLVFWESRQHVEK